MDGVPVCARTVKKCSLRRPRIGQRGAMKDCFDTNARAQNVIGVANVAADKVNARVGKGLREVKHAHALATFDERLDHRPTEKTRAADDEVVALRQRDKALRVTRTRNEREDRCKEGRGKKLEV